MNNQYARLVIVVAFVIALVIGGMIWNSNRSGGGTVSPTPNPVVSSPVSNIQSVSVKVASRTDKMDTVSGDYCEVGLTDGSTLAFSGKCDAVPGLYPVGSAVTIYK